MMTDISAEHIAAIVSELQEVYKKSQHELFDFGFGAPDRPAIDEFKYLAAKHMSAILIHLVIQQQRNAALEALVREAYTEQGNFDPIHGIRFHAWAMDAKWRERAAKLLEGTE